MSDETTILDVFAPPPNLVAHSAVLVAMTGSQDFLEDALVQFTGLKAKQRAEQGLVNVYLLLDPAATPGREGVFSPGALPGLHELQPRKVKPALLHAKLGLFAFARSKTGVPTYLRLAVFTSNFTYTCAKHQLELVSVTEAVVKEGSAQERADIAAGAVFVEKLIERRYQLAERAVTLPDRKLTRRLDVLLDTCKREKPHRALPRFIHSLDQPLYPQIREQMRRLSGNATRNFLLCGSGFWERPKAGKPAIMAKLEALGGLTGSARRVALVEPKMAGALASWAEDSSAAGWELVAPSDHLSPTRKLHAKFIYLGKWIKEGAAPGGSLYIGSGNLSVRGLLTCEAKAREKRSPHDGVNIECGVVRQVQERLESGEFARWLFWETDTETTTFEDWEAGSNDDEVDLPPIKASPVLLARMTSPTTLTLEWSEHINGKRFEAKLENAWEPLESRQQTIAISDGLRIDVLEIRSGSQTWKVPVVDLIGRVAWVPPKFETLEDALAALLDFPIRPTEETEEDEDQATDGGDLASVGTSEHEPKTYALHTAAEFIEAMSALQRALTANLLDDWFEHIERHFQSVFPDAVISQWREHGIDIFSHLARSDFAPHEMSDAQRARYRSILTAVSKAWRLGCP